SLTGYDATVLWAKYLRGERSALEQLIQYNTEDVVHLKAIMEMAYDRLCKRTAAFLKNSLAPLFTCVGQVPRSNKHAVLSRASVQSHSTELVPQLLKKCTDSGEPPRIVGIDLTGSEKRATGW